MYLEKCGVKMKKIKLKIYRLKEKISWYKSHITTKYEHIYMPFIYSAFSTLIVCFSLFIFLYTLYELKLISFNLTESSVFKLISFNNIDYKDYYKDLVILQISTTFLTTAIISLISSIEDKKIFGEKITSKLFGKNHLLFYIPFIILYIFMILNIIFMINENHSNFLLLFFVISILLLIYIITKIGNIFISTKKYKNMLMYEYYNEYKYLTMNLVPPRDYNSQNLTNLKEETLKYILNKDLEYLKYIQVYKVILYKTLFNFPKELQEYHLNMYYAKSVVNDIGELIEHLIIVDEVDRAISLYSWMLDKFSYHNLFIYFENYETIFDSIIDKITDLQNEYKLNQYLGKISSLLTSKELQQHFAYTNDFSYTRLSKSREKHIYLGNSLYFSKIYEKVYMNKYLSEKEKISCYTKLLEMFRMSGHSCDSGIYDITNYSNQFKERKKRELPSCVLGQATLFLFLSLLNNKDERNFKLFFGMNIESNEMNYAIHTLILSLIKIEEENVSKNIYSNYYHIDINWCKTFIQNNIDLLFNTKFDKYYSNKEILSNIANDYNYISKVCMSEYDKNNIYYFLGSYETKYDKNLIDTYFECVCKRFKIENVKIDNNSKDKKTKQRIKNINEFINKKNKRKKI